MCVFRDFGSSVTGLMCLIEAMYFVKVRFKIGAQLIAVEGAGIKG